MLAVLSGALERSQSTPICKASALADSNTTTDSPSSTNAALKRGFQIWKASR